MKQRKTDYTWKYAIKDEIIRIHSDGTIEYLPIVSPDSASDQLKIKEDK